MSVLKGERRKIRLIPRDQVRISESNIPNPENSDKALLVFLKKYEIFPSNPYYQKVASDPSGTGKRNPELVHMNMKILSEAINFMALIRGDISLLSSPNIRKEYNNVVERLVDFFTEKDRKNGKKIDTEALEKKFTWELLHYLFYINEPIINNS